MIPKELDGAKIILFSSYNSYGYADEEEIKYLSIAKYDDNEEYYLFACNDNFEVIGDTVHESIEIAKDFALEFYEKKEIKWRKP